MDNPFQSPRILSICTGYGGLDDGVRQCLGDVRHSAFVEIEAILQYYLVKKMEEGLLAPTPIWPDVTTLDPGPFRGRIDGIIGGYPCQPFSVAGQRLGADDPRHLWPHIERLIASIGPVWGFFENVPGHINLGFSDVCFGLHRLGYAVEAALVRADQVGAPHERERLFFLAVRWDWLEHTQSRGPGIRRNPAETGQGFGPSGRGKEMDYTHYGRQLGADEAICAGRDELVSPSDDMANGHDCEHGLPKHQQGQGWQCAEQNNDASGCCEELGDSAGIGSGRGFANKNTGQPRQTSVSYNFGQQILAPKGQGHEQYSWEEARTLESGLGSTVNGYNHRIDLLRALGNGVVSPQAAAAMRLCMWEHGIEQWIE